MTRSLLDIVKLSTQYLGDHGSDTPRLDAELLAAHALGIERLAVYLQFDRPLGEDEVGEIRELVRRRSGGEPMAYILGKREFFGRDFRVTPDVLIPRPDTETLIEAVAAWARARDAIRLLDVGTGSGCIAVTLAAELPQAEVVATDVSPAALDVARENARSHGVEERIEFRAGSWGQPLAAGEMFDVLVSNPPYVTQAEREQLMRDVRDFEPGTALFADGDGLSSYRELVAIASAHLSSGGMFALEVDPRRAATVAELVARLRTGSTTDVLRDLAGHERVVVNR